MATITTRSGKGSPLTNSEVDANFTNLNTDKVELTDLSVTDSGGDGSLAYNNSTGVITYTGPSASEVRAHISAGTGVTFSSGEIAIGQAVATSSNVTFNNIIAAGNLTVNGTTVTVNSTTVTVDDPIFTLGGDSAPSSDDNKDRGIEFRWHNGSAAKVGFFGYDDSASAFTFIQDATNSSEVFSGSVGNVIFGAATVSGLTLGSTAITATGAEINILDGVTSTAAELNLLDGVTSTTAELNILDGVTSTAAELNVLDGITSTTAELNYTDGVTSNIQTQLDAKQTSDAQLTDVAGLTPSDGGFIVGDGSNFVLESGATVRTSLGLAIGTNVLAFDTNLQAFVTAFTLPTSDGTSGQALVTNASGTLSFSDVDSLPSQSGNSGKFLTTNGTAASWGSVDALPSQSGNSGYFLTTNGSAASWSNLLDDPTFTGTVTINSNEAVTIPSGTTAQRPTAATGMLRYNSTLGHVEFYNGSAWSNINVDQAYSRTNITATSGQTSFSVSYTVGYVDVYLNGVKLIIGTDVTATSGSALVLASGAATGDLLEAIAWNAADISQQAYTKTGFTATANQTTFTVSYTVGFVNVYLNGVLLLESTEYTATNGTSIVLAAGAAVNDSVIVEAFTTFSAANALAVTNNLSDLNNAATALTNLGLTSTAAELNILDGVTSTAAELNILDGVTSTAAELNILDGVTSTAAELNILDGVTSTAAELNYSDGVTSNIQTQLDTKASTGKAIAMAIVFGG